MENYMKRTFNTKKIIVFVLVSYGLSILSISCSKTKIDPNNNAKDDKSSIELNDYRENWKGFYVCKAHKNGLIYRDSVVVNVTLNPDDSTLIFLRDDDLLQHYVKINKDGSFLENGNPYIIGHFTEDSIFIKFNNSSSNSNNIILDYKGKKTDINGLFPIPKNDYRTKFCGFYQSKLYSNGICSNDSLIVNVTLNHEDTTVIFLRDNDKLQHYVKLNINGTFLKNDSNNLNIIGQFRGDSLFIKFREFYNGSEIRNLEYKAKKIDNLF